MPSVRHARKTLEDLYLEPGKAELVGGRIIRYMTTGYKPNRVAFKIAMSLNEYAAQTGKGEAFTDMLGYAVPELPSGREAFCPDASYYDGPLPKNPMKFIEGPPTLAVEVRSEGDYGPKAEKEMAAKRLDYFAAGSLAVWDVDTVNECVHLYQASHPETPATFKSGDEAHAEPALPGWRVAVKKIFG